MNLRANAKRGLGKSTQTLVSNGFGELESGGVETASNSKKLSYILILVCCAAVLAIGSVNSVQNSTFFVSPQDIAPMLATSTVKSITPLIDSPVLSVSFEKPEHVKLEGTFKRQWMILPKYNLMFCTIAKSGSSSLRRFGKIVTKCHRNPMLCNRPYDYMYSDEDLVSILRNESWTKAVVFRDPVERFLSAYKDKCVKRDHDRHCKHLSDDGTPFSLDEYIVAMTDPDEHSWEPDSHWAQQFEMCGKLPNIIAFFDVIAFLSHDKKETYNQMKSILELKRQSVPLALQKALHDVFDPGHKAANEGRHEKLTPKESSLKLLHEFYQKDYELLNSVSALPATTNALKKYLFTS